MNIKETKRNTVQNGYIVYRHIRHDKNEPFYIGIGSERRSKDSGTRRSTIWNNITAKSSYDIEILFEDLTWEEACLKEKEFILIYGRKDKKTGSLCNMTDGGDGAPGQIHSEETKFKRGLAITGEKHGMYGKTHTDILKAKWSKERSREKHNLARKVLNAKTNEIFNCVKDASDFYSINYSTLCSWLNKSRPNNSDFTYI
jgi:hypothetical protein